LRGFLFLPETLCAFAPPLVIAAADIIQLPYFEVAQSTPRCRAAQPEDHRGAYGGH
jgi:hypothetical protein